MKDRDDLIYSLIFSDITDYEIEISEYVTDIYKYDRFIKEIKNILIKSQVNLIKDKVDADVKTVIWKLKIDRNSNGSISI